MDHHVVDGHTKCCGEALISEEAGDGTVVADEFVGNLVELFSGHTGSYVAADLCQRLGDDYGILAQQCNLFLSLGLNHFPSYFSKIYSPERPLRRPVFIRPS